VSHSSIIIVGAEGSGTTPLWNCVARHPQLAAMTALAAPPATGPLPADGTILHLSLPSLRPMRWFDGHAVPRGVRVIVQRRSPLHTVFSAYRRFYRAPKPAWRNYLRAATLEATWIARHEPLCVTYEDLVHNTATVLRRLYAFLGVDADFLPPVEVTDGNDERWLQDPSFASFMRHTFDVDSLRVETRAVSSDPVPQADRFVLRGGAVAWRGCAILLPGERGTGTSQLVAALVRAGARPIADGQVTLDGEGRLVVPGTFASIIRGGREAVDLALIVATAYKEGAEWQPKEDHSASAVVPILDHAAARSGSLRRLMQVAARLAPRVTTLSGPRPEAEQVAPAILAYLDGMLDGRSPERVADREPPDRV